MNSSAKKLISLLLAVMMLASLGVGALADNGKEYDYDKYMCIGDSIAAGCGLTKSGEETVFDQNAENFAYVYSEEYIYLGHDYPVVPKAYHSLVANAIDAELLQCAKSGMRAVELRYWLEGIYNDYDKTCSWDATYFDYNLDGKFDLSDLDSYNELINYTQKIKDADVISINVGSNDVFSFTFGQALPVLYAETKDPILKALLENLKAKAENGSKTDALFVELLESAQKIGRLPQVMAVVIQTFEKTYQQYAANYNAVMKKIYEINPDATVVNVGVFNPLRYFRFSPQVNIDFSPVMEGIVVRMNNLLKGYTNTYKNCYYADVTKTETYSQNLNDPLFWQYFTLKVHPTIAGHQHMTNQIVSVLPAKDVPSDTNKLPFTDVQKGYWAYDDIAYVYEKGIMQGMTATTFEPETNMSRAQFVSALYRMAGKPSVAGKTEPFADVSDSYWAHDAIVWGYNTGVIKGYSDTEFAPKDSISRAQLVTMLYRYAGSPAAKGSLSAFKDAASIAAPYQTAAVWANENKIVQGYQDGTFRPNALANRAQLAVILARYDRLEK